MTTPEQPLSPECAAYQEVVQAVLDQELPAQELDRSHPRECRQCGDLQTGANLLLGWEPQSHFPVVSKSFTNQIEAKLLQEAGQLGTRRRVTQGSLLVGLLLLLAVPVVYFFKPTSVQPKVIEPAPMPKPLFTLPATNLDERVSEVGSALIAMTRRTTDETLKPAQSWISWPSNPLPAEEVPLNMPSDSLRSLPESAKVGLDPVATGTKRAVNKLLKDLSAFTPSKPKS